MLFTLKKWQHPKYMKGKVFKAQQPLRSKSFVYICTNKFVYLLIKPGNEMQFNSQRKKCPCS